MLGLLLKLLHIAVGAGIEDAHAGGLFHGDLLHGDGERRIFFQMLLEHLGVVHLVNVVAGEDQDVLGIIVLDEAEVLVDRVGGAGEPGALFPRAEVGRQDIDAAVGGIQIPGLAVADVAVELKGSVLGQDTDGVDPGVCAVGQRKVDDTILSAKGYAGLCHVLRQGVKTGALSACKKHRYTAFLHMQPPLLNIFVFRRGSPQTYEKGFSRCKDSWPSPGRGE